jgi:hypothetical protein
MGQSSCTCLLLKAEISGFVPPDEGTRFDLVMCQFSVHLQSITSPALETDDYPAIARSLDLGLTQLDEV